MTRTITPREIGIAVGAFLLLLVAGTIGYSLLLDESPFEALFRTVNTIYTAGLVDAPDDTAAKVFTLALVIGGVAVFLYVFALLIELAVSGALGSALVRRRTARRVGKLENHYIICGYGRVGRRIAREFRESGLEYVVIDFNPDAVQTARDLGDLVIEGSGTDARSLTEASLASARGLVASSDSDVDNLYVTLSARAARPDLLIVARAANEDAAEKLRLAGADRVVQPYATAGLEMAKLVAKPQVAAFLDIVTSAGGPDLSIEEIEVTAGCGKAGSTIRELRIRHETGALVIAVQKPDGRFDATPSPDTALEVGDVVIAVGTVSELQQLEDIFAERQ
ncbi:MAG TPA: TrkA family potassium uptake protein [Gaiellaceae bacterium]|nr:TrkA family potassium uptake protein [Gaiellaceae bacterium]